MGRRDSAILEILTSEHRVEVTSLAERLGVSQVTMRKDLDSLVARGIVIREHGYAELKSPNDIAGRLAYHYQAKLAIAQKAASLISDGETVMVESGSCCALLARALFETPRDITVVTNSAFIADYVRDMPHSKVVLLGGVYQNDAQVMVGPLVATCADSFLVSKLFVGTDGYADGTFTNADMLRAQAVHDMAQRAEQVLVVTESEKFSRRGVVPLDFGTCPVSVVTDSALDAAVSDDLTRRGIEVHKA